MTDPANRPPAGDADARAEGLLYPLDLIYERAGIAAPEVAAVIPEEIPLPYRTLLVHRDGMTPTLERHFGGRVALRLLYVFTSGASYFRHVLLVSEHTGRPVEMGAIRMELDTFDAPIRRKILEGEIPFGRIMLDFRFDCRSEPTAFLAVTPNPEMMGVFWMREPSMLYGRRTRIVHRGAVIGDIVEVLPLLMR